MRNRATPHHAVKNRTLERKILKRWLMNGTLAVAAMLATFAALHSPAAGAATVWFDSDGDGLPQNGGLLAVSTGAELTLDVWINSGSFQWTNYLVFVEWDGCLSLSDPEYVINGGTNFPVDDFSRPSAIGFGGLGYSEHGSDLIARITVQIDLPRGCCIKPITAVDDYEAFSQLTSGASYRLFEDTDGLCFESLDSRQERSWGGVKSLYK